MQKQIFLAQSQLILRYEVHCIANSMIIGFSYRRYQLAVLSENFLNVNEKVSHFCPDKHHRWDYIVTCIWDNW